MLEWLFNKLTGRRVLSRPEQLVPYLIEHFSEATEEQISRVEHEVFRGCPTNPEKALLYAFRVSKCVPRVTTFKTLGSRWRVACSGPRGKVGLLAGRHSANYRRAHKFLSSLYLKRFWELAKAIADKADDSAAKRKSASAKRNVYNAAIRKIRDGGRELDHYAVLSADASLWRKEAQRWIDFLNQRLAAIGGEPS